jgi:nitrogen fixation protein NifU and related proteins
LRLITRTGCRLFRSWKLLRKEILIMDALDDFLDNLQNEIFDDAKQAFGEKGFQRWRNPKFNGKMENPDGMGRVTGECGDTMEIYLKFKNNRVFDVSYFTDGCASSNISGSFAAELTLGKDPDEIADITAEIVLNTIGKLPEENLHCASLAARTVQEALSNYMSGLQKKTI